MRFSIAFASQIRSDMHNQLSTNNFHTTLDFETSPKTCSWLPVEISRISPHIGLLKRQTSPKISCWSFLLVSVHGTLWAYMEHYGHFFFGLLWSLSLSFERYLGARLGRVLNFLCFRDLSVVEDGA